MDDRKSNTPFKSHYHYESIDSTNRVLKDLARRQAPAGTFVTAAHQTAGKGRLGRSFYSPTGHGLYLSCLYRPKAAEDLLSITMRAAASAVLAVETVCQISPGIKWVNDLYFEHRKIAGILAEGVTEGSRLTAVVLGIGINLWEPASGYPEPIAKIAGSVFGRRQPDPKIWHALADELKARLYPLHDGPEMIDIYRRHSIVIGKKVTLLNHRQKINGVVKGFTDSGALILETEDGSTQIIASGEISLRLKNQSEF